MKKFFSNLFYLLLSMPLGILYFFILSAGFVFGAGLAITIIGIPILVAMIFITYILGDLERATTSRMLGIPIVKPEGQPSKSDSAKSILVAQLKSKDFWKELGYLLFVKLVIGMFSFTIAIALFILPLSLLASPLIVAYFPQVDIWFFNTRIDTMSKALVCLAAGSVAAPVSVLAINGLASAHGKITNWALGKAE